MARPVVHFEITGENAPALQSFYSRLFDWKVDAKNPMGYGLVQAATEKNSIGGGIGPSVPGAVGLTFYVQVDDLKATLAHAEKLGGKTVLPPTEIPGFGASYAQLRDPEGNVVGIYAGPTNA